MRNQRTSAFAINHVFLLQLNYTLPRVKLWLLQEPALSFGGVARVRMLWSSRVPEQKVQDRPVRQPAKSAMTV